jgi:hypothetical protein
VIILLLECATAHSLHRPTFGSLTRRTLQVFLLQIHSLNFLYAHVLIVFIIVPSGKILAPLELSVLNMVVSRLAGVDYALLLVDGFLYSTCSAHP